MLQTLSITVVFGRIEAIKLVRAVCQVGLKEAKAVVDMITVGKGTYLDIPKHLLTDNVLHAYNMRSTGMFLLVQATDALASAAAAKALNHLVETDDEDSPDLEGLLIKWEIEGHEKALH
jgi:hypothetical protein